MRTADSPDIATARHLTDCVEYFLQVSLGLAPALGHSRQKRLDLLPFLVGQIIRVTLSLAGKLGYLATAFSSPYSELPSQPIRPSNLFSYALKETPAAPGRSAERRNSGRALQHG